MLVLFSGGERHSRGHLVDVNGLEVRGIDLDPGVRQKPLRHIRDQVSETIDRFQICIFPATSPRSTSDSQLPDTLRHPIRETHRTPPGLLDTQASRLIERKSCQVIDERTAGMRHVRAHKPAPSLEAVAIQRSWFYRVHVAGAHG
ncbi:hypothetical protein [Propioniciclava soli]|uniref:hypothetical protein n=1 Tax=Propioniciclava soli TaxID=2775081 RepID=UPI001E5B77C8|nr:hypothetical protein [Propioniciclava soli]